MNTIDTLNNTATRTLTLDPTLHSARPSNDTPFATTLRNAREASLNTSTLSPWGRGQGEGLNTTASEASTRDPSPAASGGGGLAKGEAGGGLRSSDHDPAFTQARQAAADLISVSLVKPILAQLRASTMAAEPFKPGLWEKQFAPMIDAAWSDNLVNSSNWDIVDAVARRLMKQADTTDPPTPEPAEAQQRSAQP